MLNVIPKLFFDHHEIQRIMNDRRNGWFAYLPAIKWFLNLRERDPWALKVIFKDCFWKIDRLDVELFENSFPSLMHHLYESCVIEWSKLLRIGDFRVNFVVNFKDWILRILSHVRSKWGEVKENIQASKLPKARVEDSLIGKEILKGHDWLYFFVSFST